MVFVTDIVIVSTRLRLSVNIASSPLLIKCPQREKSRHLPPLPEDPKFGAAFASVGTPSSSVRKARAKRWSKSYTWGSHPPGGASHPHVAPQATDRMSARRGQAQDAPPLSRSHPWLLLLQPIEPAPRPGGHDDA